nr:hypothetical protein [Paenibacillus albidus]
MNKGILLRLMLAVVYAGAQYVSVGIGFHGVMVIQAAMVITIRLMQLIKGRFLVI